jgi:hypothetical protein
MSPELLLALLLSAGEATLPLEDLLKLHRALDATGDAAADVPAVAATLQSADLEARLLDSGAEVSVSFRVAVIAGEAWTRLTLLELAPALHVTELPQVENAVLARDGAELVLLTRHAGSYTFTVRLFIDATRSERGRRVSLAVGRAAAARLRVRYDEKALSLSTAGMRDADAVLVFPSGGRFDVAWRLAGTVLAAPARVERPPVESVVESAHVSLVATLDGHATTRVLYELRLEGSKRIGFALPAGAELAKVFVNGVAVPAAVRDSAVELDVTPRRAGDELGQVELVLHERRAGYLLSGHLSYAFPAATWRTNEVWVTLHLPDVFNYTWTGGSLAAVGAAPDTAFTHAIPTPGKTVHARQLLVHEAPTLRLSYDVSLEGSYFH